MVFSTLEHILTHIVFGRLLVTRWIFSGHLPFSNLYESLIFLSWTFSIFYMVLCLKKKKLLFQYNNNAKYSFYPRLCYFGSFNRNASILNISACFTVPLVNDAHFLFFNETLSFAEIKYMNMNDKKNLLQKTPFMSDSSYINYYRYQFIQQLDRWGYRTISLGFIFLTVGNISGAVWANEAWGSYWNWDPKETWAFITWIIFAIYLHIRKNKKLEYLNSSIVASMGFLIIWICYLGINLLGIGLHSYGSFTSN
uniref:Cytochrome c assembly protein domain-containing protein n=1 Tax=Phaseolus vulgaris TaxID=3885 RepID=V7CGE3_PHAVU|nr:hypothetical protein PHAVU_002G050000g [Phaseolus vulgaris]ESW29184.1 hypothetical protein PHAVU_002G050000g [Phaseolus vulgaris]